MKDTFAPAFGVGFLARPTDSIEVGFSYDSGLDINAKGDGTPMVGSAVPAEIEPQFDEYARCAKDGTKEKLKSCLNFSLPQVATFGARYIMKDADGNEKADIELDVSWEQWSKASDVEIIVDGIAGRDLNTAIMRHGFNDVISVALGGAYSMPMGKNKLVFRGGTAYDTAAAPNSWQRVDMDGGSRMTFSTGMAYEAAKYRIDFGGAVLLQKDRTATGCEITDDTGCNGTVTPVDERKNPDPAYPLAEPADTLEYPINAGTYSSGYFMFGLGVTTWF